MTGRTVRQLTTFRGHSHHLYFTNPGWWDEGKRLLFGSDRRGRRNLFSLELDSGEITQHTDSDMPGPPVESTFMDASINPMRPECTFWRGMDLIAIDLSTNRERRLWRCPDGFFPSNQGFNSNGNLLYFGLLENLTHRIEMALLQGYVGFADYWEAQPLCRLMKFNMETGRAEILHEEKCWLGHINPSPTQPHLFTFCHEGPWDRVDHRIWVFDSNTGYKHPVCAPAPGQMVGHEYWLSDGLHIGYHGYDKVSESFVFGSVCHDDTGRRDIFSKISTGHTHSLDFSLVIGDGELDFEVPVIRIFPLDRDGDSAPRILCRHDSSFRTQQMHPHPRISPDGKKVIFTSDRSSYGQVYEVEIGDWHDLPILAETGRTVKRIHNEQIVTREEAHFIQAESSKEDPVLAVANGY